MCGNPELDFTRRIHSATQSLFDRHQSILKYPSELSTLGLKSHWKQESAGGWWQRFPSPLYMNSQILLDISRHVLCDFPYCKVLYECKISLHIYHCTYILKFGSPSSLQHSITYALLPALHSRGQVRYLEERFGDEFISPLATYFSFQASGYNL